MTSPTFDARQAERLSTETIAWLTTVNADGAPAPTPVWFLWTGTEVLVSSRPRTGKLAGVRRNPLVSLHLNSSPEGGEVLVVTGRARVDEEGPTADEWSAYLDKYRAGLARLNTTAEAFRADYSVLLRIVPEKLRGW